MNARTLTNGLALSATLFFASAVLAVDAQPDSGFRANGSGKYTYYAPTSPYAPATYAPTSLGDPENDASLGAAGIVYDPGTDDDLAPQRDPSLFKIMTARYAPTALKLLLAKR